MHSIVLIIVLLLQQLSGISAFASVGGVSNKIGSIGYSSTPPSRLEHSHHIININHRIASSSTSLSAAAPPIQSISAAATSISTFYKASPLIAGFSIGLLCRMIQYTQDANNNTNTTNIKERFSLRRRSSNYAMVLLLGLVLGLLIEVLLYAGAVVPISEYSISLEI